MSDHTITFYNKDNANDWIVDNAPILQLSGLEIDIHDPTVTTRTHVTPLQLLLQNTSSGANATLTSGSLVLNNSATANSVGLDPSTGVSVQGESAGISSNLSATELVLSNGSYSVNINLPTHNGSFLSASWVEIDVSQNGVARKAKVLMTAPY